MAEQVEALKCEMSALKKMLNPFGSGNCKGGEGTMLIQKAQRGGSGYWLLSLLSLQGRPLCIKPLFCYIAYVLIIVICFLKLIRDEVFEHSNIWAGLQNAMSMYGTALFFLLAYRTDQAYSRWWEGRNTWDGINGAVFSISRNLAGGGIQSKKMARRNLRWLAAYVISLKTSLRFDEDISELQGAMSPQEYKELQAVPCKHRPLFCVQKLTEIWIHCDKNKIDASTYTQECVYYQDALVRYISNMHRIRDTPIPFAYLAHLRTFLILWLLQLPFVYLTTLEYITIPICIIIGYSLFGMEGIGLEVESPFGTDFNDLPTDQIVQGALEVVLACYAATNDLPAIDGDDGDGFGFEWGGAPALKTGISARYDPSHVQVSMS